MQDALEPFACVRLPYNGVKDTIRDIEVDLEMNRLYAACNAGGVFVWNLATHQPFALMKHDQWVNGVRCFPPKVDLAERSTTTSPTTQLVLTACENGVLSAWNPMTFLIQSRVRPGTGPLTKLLLARVDRHTKKVVTTSDYLCYVASMRHVYVIRVSPEFEVLHDLVHAGFVLCMTPHHSPRTQSLVCGQDNGSISMWSLSSGKYECTLDYPPDSKDIIEDSKITSIHKPHLEDKGVTHTFVYNRQRSAMQKNPALQMNITDTTEETAKYIRQMSLELDPFYVSHPEQNEALNKSSKQWWQGLWPPGADPHRASSPLQQEDDMMVYDLRRVTCVVATPRDSTKTHRFYSGHGTGEVLIWEASFRRQPVLLLKKVQVFTFGSWVWHMQAMEIPRVEDPFERFSVDLDRPVALQLCVWGDGGAVRYIQATGRVTVTDGPGFLATSSCFWRGPQFDLRHALTIFPVKTGKSAEPQENQNGAGVLGTAAQRAAQQEEEELRVGYYMIMGSMEGRVELFDMTGLVEKLRNGSW
eukprot:gene5357-3853_t